MNFAKLEHKASFINYLGEGLRGSSYNQAKKKKKGEQKDRALWEYAAVSSLKHKFKVLPSIFVPIVEVLKNEYAAATRNAAILCYNQSIEEPVNVSSIFHKITEKMIASADKKKSVDSADEFNFSDPITKIYLIRMFVQLCNSNQVTNGDVFYKTITHLILDKNMRVALEAVVGLTKIPSWDKFEDAVLTTEDNQRKVISVAIDRLTQALMNTQSAPMLHSAARVVAILAEAHRTFLGDGTDSFLLFSINFF